MTTTLSLVDHPHEVADLVDHAAHRGRILERALAVALVEPEPLQRRLLVAGPADRAGGLLDGDGLLGGGGRFCHHALSRASRGSRPRISATFLPRRAATARGLVRCPSASNVALIMLCGLELPTDLARKSWTRSEE